MDCVFCKIAAGEIPAKKAYEDDVCLAFYDLEPQAPVHVLLIPKQHIGSVSEITSENSAVVAHIFEVAGRLAKELGLEKGLSTAAKTAVNLCRICISICWAAAPWAGLRADDTCIHF